MIVEADLPNTSAQFDTPAVVYTLMNPTGSNVLNFNKFIVNLDMKTFLNVNVLPYEYKIYSSVDEDPNHTITDNLKFINNNKITNVFINAQNTVKIELLIIKE